AGRLGRRGERESSQGSLPRCHAMGRLDGRIITGGIGHDGDDRAESLPAESPHGGPCAAPEPCLFSLGRSDTQGCLLVCLGCPARRSAPCGGNRTRADFHLLGSVVVVFRMSPLFSAIWSNAC